ncbi:hypothetical protein ACFV6G_29475 [Streptomyces lavendulae]
MSECMTCSHPGAHAAVVPREGWPERCADCWRCDAQARAEVEKSE